MKAVLFAAITLASSLGFAATDGYYIESDLTINGKFITKARISTLPGLRASVTVKDETGRDTFIAVTPSEGAGEIKGRKAILMKFEIGYVENGKEKIISTPEIMVAEKSKAEMSIGPSAQGKDKDSVNITTVAERRSL